MYFSKFPTIPYDAAGTNQSKDVKNLLRRVAVRTKIKTNTLFYDTYDVKEGETPESIADKLYDDPELHWVILLVNDITDIYHQWPMRYSQFLQFVDDKYDDPNGVHHYEIAQSSGNGVTAASLRETSSYVQTIVDVTNTTNVKVKFGLSAATTGVNVQGETARNTTNMVFIRLGDT